MRDLQIGFDTVDILRVDQIKRAARGREYLVRRHGKPAARYFGTGDRRTLGFRLQHEIERHRQPRRSVVAGRLVEPRQAVDQADFAAACFSGIGSVHAVDDAGQHESRVGRIEQRAIEQLKIKAGADADRFLRQARVVLCDVAIELTVDRLAQL